MREMRLELRYGGPDRIQTGDLQRDRLACWAATPRVRSAASAEDSRPGGGCRTKRVRARGHGTIPAVKRLPLAVAVAALLVAVAGSALGWGAPSSPSPSPSIPGVAAASPSSAPAGSSAPSTSEPPATGPSDAGGGSPSPQPSGTPAPSITAAVPIVPVAQFRTTVQSIGRDDVRAAIAGTSPTWQGLELVASEADAILAGLGVDRPAGDQVSCSRPTPRR